MTRPKLIAVVSGLHYDSSNPKHIIVNTKKRYTFKVDSRTRNHKHLKRWHSVIVHTKQGPSRLCITDITPANKLTEPEIKTANQRSFVKVCLAHMPSRRCTFYLRRFIRSHYDKATYQSFTKASRKDRILRKKSQSKKEQL